VRRGKRRPSSHFRQKANCSAIVSAKWLASFSGLKATPF
jgi:hypothetical protein